MAKEIIHRYLVLGIDCESIFDDICTADTETLDYIMMAMRVVDDISEEDTGVTTFYRHVHLCM